MPEFRYVAARPDGNIVRGNIAAAGRDAALSALRSRGLTPVDITGAASSAEVHAGGVANGLETRVRWSLGLGGKGRAPGFHQVHALTGEMAIMLRAGLPLDRCLRVLIDMNRQPGMARLLDDLLTAVKSGRSLSQALQAHHGLFGDFYINMVRSGEASGQLAEVLTRLAEHLERVKTLRESVVSALIYPLILVVVAVVSVVLMLGFVVPQFESLFDDMGEALPLPTRLIVAAGDAVSEWGWLIALVMLGTAALLRFWFATPGGRSWWHRRQLRLPVVGELLRRFEITRFARSMGTLLANGVSIVNAIRIASETMGNSALRAAVEGVAPAVKQGGRVSDALGASGLFTPMALHMVRLGEETGRLDEMLIEVARVHDQEVQAGIKRTLVLVEPVLILTLGAVIALIIVSILMGILSVNELAM